MDLDEILMRNLYSCGCYVVGDVPVLSRCAYHNGYLVASLDNRVTKRQQLKFGNCRIVHEHLSEVLPKLNKPLDFAFSYPESHQFLAHQFCTPLGWTTARIEVFAHLKRLLKPEGKAVFIVDTHILRTVLYQAMLQGFQTDVRFTRVHLKHEPLINFCTLGDEFVYKAVVGLNTGPLPRFRMTDPTPFFDALEVPETARILDTSCILFDVLQKARPSATLLGIVEDVRRFERYAAAVDVGNAPAKQARRCGKSKVRSKRPQ